VNRQEQPVFMILGRSATMSTWSYRHVTYWLLPGVYWKYTIFQNVPGCY